MIPSRTCFLLLVSLVLVSVNSAWEPFEAFLETHCVSCHGPDKDKGCTLSFPGRSRLGWAWVARGLKSESLSVIPIS